MSPDEEKAAVAAEFQTPDTDAGFNQELERFMRDAALLGEDEREAVERRVSEASEGYFKRYTSSGELEIPAPPPALTSRILEDLELSGALIDYLPHHKLGNKETTGKWRVFEFLSAEQVEMMLLAAQRDNFERDIPYPEEMLATVRNAEQLLAATQFLRDERPDLLSPLTRRYPRLAGGNPRCIRTEEFLYLKDAAPDRFRRQCVLALSQRGKEFHSLLQHRRSDSRMAPTESIVDHKILVTECLAA